MVAVSLLLDPNLQNKNIQNETGKRNY
jgi:hypothetical protein